MELLDNESFLLNFFGDGNSDIIMGSPEATKTNTMNSTGSESNLDIIDDIKKGDIFEGFGIKDINKKKVFIKTSDKKIEKESKSPLSVSTTKQNNINIFDNLLDNFNEGEENIQTLTSSNKKEKPKVSKSTAELIKTNEEIKPKKHNGWDSNEDDDDDYSFPIISKRGKKKEIINTPKINIKSNENKTTEEKKSIKKENNSLFYKNKTNSSNQLTKKKGEGIDLDSLLNF